MLDLKVDEELCVGCGECVKDCPVNVLVMEDDSPAVNPARENACLRCRHCLSVCKPGALSVFGIDPKDCRSIKGGFPSVESMETLVMGRRSVRRYKDKAVDRQTLDRLLAATSYAPTGENNMEVLYTCISDHEAMARFRIRAMELLRQKVERDSLPEGLKFFKSMLRPWDNGRDIIFRAAPHMILASVPANGPSPDADGFIGLSYFELLANTMGIGTLWCGFAKWLISDIAPELEKDLGIPEDHKLVYAMMFGYPAVKYHRTVGKKDAHINLVESFQE